MDYTDAYWEGSPSAMAAALVALGWVADPSIDSPISLQPPVRAIAPIRTASVAGRTITFALIRTTEPIPLPANVYLSEIGPAVAGAFA